jgi:hypothetical protein
MKKILAAAGIGAALIAGPVVGAGTASATNSAEIAYLQTLNNSGIVIYDTDRAIVRGYQICKHKVINDPGFVHG